MQRVSKPDGTHQWKFFEDLRLGHDEDVHFGLAVDVNLKGGVVLNELVADPQEDIELRVVAGRGVRAEPVAEALNLHQELERLEHSVCDCLAQGKGGDKVHTTRGYMAALQTTLLSQSINILCLTYQRVW